MVALGKILKRLIFTCLAYPLTLASARSAAATQRKKPDTAAWYKQSPGTGLGLGLSQSAAPKKASIIFVHPWPPSTNPTSRYT